jgi:hypothetical protein
MTSEQQLRSDARGVSEVIGSILVFGLLITLLAILQTQAIPAANQQVEFDHSIEVQGDMVDFHETASAVRTSGNIRSTSVQMGVAYPNRLLFFNPQRPAGTLRTSEGRTAEIRNIQAVDGNVDDYITGNASGTLAFDDARTFSYSANYNFLDEGPTIRYEYGVLYSDFDNSAIVQNPGSVIDDTTINLVFMSGNFSETQSARQSVDVRPVSAPSRSVTVESANGSDIEIELPTKLNVSVWEEEYGSQATVENVTEGSTNGTVEIVLDGDRRYTLRMSKLGLDAGVQKPDAEYIVPAGDGVATIGAGDNATVAYEVRDQFNNPVSGVDVELGETGDVKQTDGEGRVTFDVSPGQPQSFTGELTTCAAAKCEAEFSVQVTDFNPNPSSGVTLTAASTSQIDIPALDITFANNQMGVEFESSGGSVGISRFRINHYHQNPSAHSPVTLEDADGNQVSGIEVGGSFESGSDVESLNDVETNGTGYTMTFGDNVETSHYVVMTVVFEDGQQGLYFASPQS